LVESVNKDLEDISFSKYVSVITAWKPSSHNPSNILFPLIVTLNLNGYQSV
jgi:hypothetical protein